MSGLFSARLFAGQLFVGRLFVKGPFTEHQLPGPTPTPTPAALASMYGPGSDDIASPWQQRRAKRIRTTNQLAIALILAAIIEDILQ
jgi:hypothetical protein